jgi:poly [ADP-ribose] polymerase
VLARAVLCSAVAQDNTKMPASGQGGWISASTTKRTLVDVMRVNRHGEGDRYSAFEGVGNRRLLWHGTNVAVVAAIMKSGLRIMPHSGGRVGCGIYLVQSSN